MLYQSLKTTIKQYQKRKKQTQNNEEKILFKWKVLALSCCIILIVLVGILTQLIQNDKQDGSQTHNITFLPELLQKTKQLNQMTQIRNFLKGLNASPIIKFDSSQQLLNSANVNSTMLLQKIDKRNNILYFFNLQNQLTLQEYKFGMYLKRNFDHDTDPVNNMIFIHDSNQGLFSVLFNIKQNHSQRMNLISGCTLYEFNKMNNDLLLLELISIKGQSSNNVSFHIDNFKCFGEDKDIAIERIHQLTGILLNQIEETVTLKINSIEVYQLRMDQSKIQEM